MKRNIFAVIGLVAIILAVYAFMGNNESHVAVDHDDESLKALVHDYSVGNLKGQSASITSHQLIVTESDGQKETYDLPEDEFFVSIAPYYDQTRP